MERAAAGVALALALAACQFDAGLDTTRFRCERDGDCPGGTTCRDEVCEEGGKPADGGDPGGDGGGGDCPCSIWSDAIEPPVPDSQDATPGELGVRVRADIDGVVTAIRYYKALLNVGPHVGHVWSEEGDLLGTAEFEDETAEGWQEATLAQPVEISAGTAFVVSYYAPGGHYAYQESYFGSDIVSGPLRALQDDDDAPNGVYVYDEGGGFPGDTHESSNYWVDLVFDEAP